MGCEGCGRPDGARWCLLCTATAVRTPDQARPLVLRTVRWAGRLGMVFSPDFVLRVSLIDAPTLPGHLGSTLVYRIARGRRVHSRVIGIQIVRDLPETLFMGVVAHELAHVWAALRGWKLYRWAEEGLGEIIAHQFYQDLGTRQALFLARRIETNPHPIYGGGFRRLRALLGGTDGLRRFIRG